MIDRNPHNHLAGYVFERKHPRGHIVCYEAEKQDFDATDGRYIVVIETGNGRHVGPQFTSPPKARVFVKAELDGGSGYDWQL